MKRFVRVVLIGCIIGAGLAFETLAAAPAEAFCSIAVGDPFDCPSGDFGHEGITVEALGSVLNKGARSEMLDEHAYIDAFRVHQGKWHFDNCRVRDGASNINSQYNRANDIHGTNGGVLTEFDPGAPSPLDAADEFGQLLHAAQDFYSHSNWVELNTRQGTEGQLYTDSVGNWPTPANWSQVRPGVVVVAGESLPAGWHGSIESNHIPRFFTGSNVYSGLITGSVSFPSETDDNCPDSVTITHDELNKDTIHEEPGHTEARALAVRQTRHEWCRLLHKLRDRWGAAGPAAAMGLWLANGASPNVPGTPCAPGDPGPVYVKVVATRIRVLEDTDDFSDGEINTRLILFSHSMKHSAITQSPRRAVVDEPQDISSRPFPAAMCVSPGEFLSASVQGWDDDDSGDNSSGVIGEFDADGDDDDEALSGVTVTLGRAADAAGTRSGASGHLSANLTVTTGPGPDPDLDGLGECVERATHKTDPNNPDTDGDGLRDGDEVNRYRTNPLRTDSDFDGLSDSDEVFTYRTDPRDADTDDDGLNDGPEVLTYRTNPLNRDTDGDTLSDNEEVRVRGTDPRKADTDGDGLRDDAELNVHGTSPVHADTDNDGLNDGAEIQRGTNPHDRDSDNDGLLDGPEVHQHGSNPLLVDTDGDGISDGDEVAQGTDPANADGDGDGIADPIERPTYGTDPTLYDTDFDGLSDGEEVFERNTDPLNPDTDGDEAPDGTEVARGSDPHNPDTDDDGLTDGYEIQSEMSSPINPDTDDDGLTDGKEVLTYLTNPSEPDTDFDGLPDGDEVHGGTDPLVRDTDGDGLFDGRDVDHLERAVDNTPDGELAAPAASTRTSFYDLFELAETELLFGEYDHAIKALDEAYGHLDGCGTAPDADDWVVDCKRQLQIRRLVKHVIAEVAELT